MAEIHYSEKQNKEASDHFVCDFCVLNFRTRAERNAHVMVHFEKKSCTDCNKILIRIADDWYVLHVDINCNQIKYEFKSDLNAEIQNVNAHVKTEIGAFDQPNDNVGIADHELNELTSNLDLMPMLHIDLNTEETNGNIHKVNAQLNELYSQKRVKFKRDKIETITHSKSYPLERKKPPPSVRTMPTTKAPTSQASATITPIEKKFIKIECNICHAYLSQAKFDAHLRTVHVPKIIIAKDPVKCNTCGKSFANLGSLKAHQYIHWETKRFVCSYCGREFVRLFNLTEHMNRHTGDRPYTCTVCKKTFGRDTSMRAHMRIHTGEKPYKCPIEGCERAYAYEIDLKRHKFSGHGIYTKKHFCPICSKVYSENKLLKKHLESHLT